MKRTNRTFHIEVNGKKLDKDHWGDPATEMSLEDAELEVMYQEGGVVVGNTPPETFGDMTTEEEEAFAEAFYNNWRWDFPDIPTDEGICSDQWGYPKTCATNEKYMPADDFWDKNKAEIESFFKEEKEN